jgi:hypothetical protein
MENVAASAVVPVRDHTVEAGFLTGLVIPAVIVLWALVDSSLSPLAAVGGVGMPVGAMVGAYFASGVRRASIPRVIGIVAQMGAIAAFGPALAIGVALTLPAALSVGLGALMIVPFALLIAVPVLIATVPSALAWTVVMRLFPSSWIGDGLQPISGGVATTTSLIVLVALSSFGLLHMTLRWP